MIKDISAILTLLMVPEDFSDLLPLDKLNLHLDFLAALLLIRLLTLLEVNQQLRNLINQT